MVPAGGLVSFAAVVFEPVHTSGLIDYKLEWVNSYAIGPGRFPIDLRGLSRAPQKEPVASWKYLITATPGLSAPAAGMDVEAKISALVDALTTDYTYSGSYTTTSTTLSGTLGDLVVASVDGAVQYRCFARLDMAEVKLAPARNLFAYEMPLSWHLLSEFAVVA